MKALFLVFHGFAEHNGISKKIFSQVEALRQCGIPTTLCYTSFNERGEQVRMVDDQVLTNYGSSPLAKITKRTNLSPIYDYIVKEGIEMVYMRANHNANPFLVRLLRKLRKAGVKVVMEIPTYPYDQEYDNTPLGFRSRLYIDRLFRERMASELFRIVTFGREKEIFGQRTINISNGIDFDKIPTKQHVNQNSARKINLIGVAELHFWHGYDRVIAGIANYYKTCNPRIDVTFHIVGKGFQGYDEKLRAQAEEMGVADKVVFHGQQSGEELDKLFEMADMGIASLGRHRSNITYIKTLKNREYAGRGIPFVYSEIDEDFEGMPYVMKAPADESPLNITRVVGFYRCVQHEPAEIRASIEGLLSWRAQMEKVVRVVKNCI